MCKHVYIFLCFVSLTYCENNVTEYTGILTPECVRAYFRMYVTRRLPTRNYYYYHEQLNPEHLLSQTDLVGNTSNVDLNWRIESSKIISIIEAPYMVLYGLYCGGSLIAPQWVLTAAHCQDTKSYVYAGSTQRRKAKKYKICAHFIHPLWNTTKTHSNDWDYQLVLLETPIPVTASTRPIALGNMEGVRPGDTVAISSWNYVEFKKSKMHDLLRRVYVPVMDDEECKSFPSGKFEYITPRMFCAGFLRGRKNSCQGASGGLATSNGKLVGIVSFGVSCAGAEQPAVYTNVPVARDWIKSITGLTI